MKKPKVLVLGTGGTVSQKRGRDGVFRPADEPYIKKVRHLGKYAEVTFEQVANIDSTNMTTEQRARVATLIFQSYQDYDGFVVIHGTDTMADSAAALSLMLQDLGKPIVLTGAQISIFEPDTDAEHNIYRSVRAATSDVGEVCICFGEYLLRGNRSVKIHESGFNAFESPKIGPIGENGIELILKEHRIKRFNGDPRLFTEFDTHVEVYHQGSGTSTSIFERAVMDQEVHGMVIVGYGAGNVQSRLVPGIKKATELGKPAVVVTGCLVGAADMNVCEVGSEPIKAGAIPGGDMTLETSLQKLMYSLGRAREYEGKKKIEVVKSLLHRNYCGEISDTAPRFYTTK